MGAWAYCQHEGCDAPMRKSTAREVVTGHHFCPRAHRNEPNISRDTLLMEQDERIERLEAIVKQLAKRIACPSPAPTATSPPSSSTAA